MPPRDKKPLNGGQSRHPRETSTAFVQSDRRLRRYYLYRPTGPDVEREGA